MGTDVFAAGKTTGDSQKNTDIICKIKDFPEKAAVQKYFEDTILDTISDINSILADELVLEYHVVIYNYNDKKRYTIMETKRRQSSGKQDDSKPLEYGVVGWLNNGFFSTDFIMAQAAYSRIPSHIYKLNANKHIEEVINDERVALIGKGNPPEDDFRWPETELQNTGNGVRRTYAIAAMRFRKRSEHQEEEFVGALSLDIVRYSRVYPNFAFRKSEIQQIYEKMEKIIQFIERTLEFDFNSNIWPMINVAKGE